MSKRTNDNLRIKRKYLIWLSDAKGLSEASIDKSAASISSFEAFLAGRDFKTFQSELARSFKKQLSRKTTERNGTPLSPGTINGVLRDLIAFFGWLADQPGYKSRIARSDIAYLTPDRKSETARRSTCWKPHPSPAQVHEVLRKLPTETDIQRRDRALIAFLFLTGSRESAAISLRLGHLDLRNACVHFDGRTADTKFGKSFSTGFFPIGGDVEEIVRRWVAELREIHLFSDADPLFPKTRVEAGSARRFQATGLDRAPWRGPTSAVRIFKEAFLNAGYPPFSPHRVRDTLTELASHHCRTPEDFKTWSQNMGHDDVMTTFRSYGSVSPGRQMDLMTRFRNRGPLHDDDDVLERF